MLGAFLSFRHCHSRSLHGYLSGNGQVVRTEHNYKLNDGHHAITDDMSSSMRTPGREDTRAWGLQSVRTSEHEGSWREDSIT